MRPTKHRDPFFTIVMVVTGAFLFVSLLVGVLVLGAIGDPKPKDPLVVRKASVRFENNSKRPIIFAIGIEETLVAAGKSFEGTKTFAVAAGHHVMVYEPGQRKRATVRAKLDRDGRTIIVSYP